MTSHYSLSDFKVEFKEKMSSASDTTTLGDLLKNVAAADRFAFSTLYKVVSARLLGIQLSILKNRELAEEALQETFINVWKNADSFNPDKASAMVWLNSLARNQALSTLRRQKTRAAINIPLSPKIDPDQWEKTAPLLADGIADGQILSMCIDKLENETQHCIIGVYCNGYTQKELSESLGHPLGTVKSWIRRGLLSLKECLHEHG